MSNPIPTPYRRYALALLLLINLLNYIDRQVLYAVFPLGWGFNIGIPAMLLALTASDLTITLAGEIAGDLVVDGPA